MINYVNRVNIINGKVEDLENYLQENKPQINGIIDEPVYQGEYADCWLLSGVLAMSYNEAGSEVLKDNISVNDESINIIFPGIDKSYEISNDEFKEYNLEENDPAALLSTGDDDALAIELAAMKTEADESVETKFSVKDGGNSYYMFKLFGAENIKVTKTKNDIIDAFSYFEKNSDNCSMTMGVIGTSVCGLKQDHGFAVQSVDKSTVTLVDPWDSTEEIVVSKEELIDNYENINIVYANFDKQ